MVVGYSERYLMLFVFHGTQKYFIFLIVALTDDINYKHRFYHWLMPQPINKEQEEELKKLGEKVKAIRKEKGLTLEAVANKVCKDRQSIHKLGKGKFNPSYLYLLEVCKGLDIDLQILFNDLNNAASIE